MDAFSQKNTELGKFELLPVVFLTCLVGGISFLFLLVLPGLADAQVAISLGVQELYDDNVFLENDEDRRAFIASNDLIEQSSLNGEVPTILRDEVDGDPNDDLITNINLSLATRSPYFQKYADTSVQGSVGFLLFSEFEEQNRLTLDGRIDTAVSRDVLPDPYYATLSNALVSNSANRAANAQGTASRTTQIYQLVGQTGIRGVPVADKTAFDFGYIGSLTLFLGDFLLNDREPGQFENDGADFHSHTLAATLRRQVSERLIASVTLDAGTQIFTDVETIDGDLVPNNRNRDLDRRNYSGRVGLRYTASEALQFGGYVGAEQTSFVDDDIELRPVTVLGEDGQPTTVFREIESSQNNLIFGADTSYTFAPGTTTLVGIQQDSGIDLDGDRITTRSVYANSLFSLNDRLGLTLSGRFFQFATDDELDDSTDRFEASASLAYSLTQQTSLVLGYTYADQTADSFRDDDLFGRSREYKVNRVFVGVNVGLVGLPVS